MKSVFVLVRRRQQRDEARKVVLIKQNYIKKPRSKRADERKGL